MPSERYKGVRFDPMTGRYLCCNCFDGRHFYKIEPCREVGREGQTMNVIVDGPRGAHSNCLQGDCDCPCVKLMIENHRPVSKKERKKVQAELQKTILTEDVLVFREGQSEPTLEVDIK